MSPRRAAAPDTLVALDPAAPVPLYRQLYDGLREAILAGRLAPGARLPSSRLIAAELGLARNTVALAFDQLRAEGYFEGRERAGTFVARTLPDRMLHVPSRARDARDARGERRERGARPPGGGSTRPSIHPSAAARVAARTPLVALTVANRRCRAAEDSGPAALGAPAAFRPGVPALDTFPRALWARLTARRWRDATLPLGYGDPAGYAPLRRAIAAYVSAARGARCTAEQVIVVGGSQQGLDLAARVLLDPGDAVWMEDPGYPGAGAVFTMIGARLVPVPVDAEGIRVADGERAAPTARLAYVSPSHQYPTGATMSASRRLALLAWAARTGAWVVEDDYDSEFRYASRPLPCLQGLDVEGRVIYVGTFSKTLVPALRLGYLVVPEPLVDAFLAARTVADRQSPVVEQAVLADFLDGGHFARHVRRMRALYLERQEALLAAAAQHLAGRLEVRPAASGMHLVAWLPPGEDDVGAAARALAAGVEARAVSRLAMAPLARGGLMLGYAGFTPRQIHRAAERLAAGLGA